MRVIPADQKPGEPAELSFTDAKRLQAKRAKKASEFGKRPGRGGPGGGRNFGAKRGGKASQNRTGYQARQDKRDSSGSSSSSSHSNASAASDDNPWGNWKP